MSVPEGELLSEGMGSQVMRAKSGDCEAAIVQSKLIVDYGELSLRESLPPYISKVRRCSGATDVAPRPLPRTAFCVNLLTLRRTL